VIRSFALADMLLVYSLQRSDTLLAIEHILTHPRSPLWLALTSPWPWAGVGVATYVARSREQGQASAGFVQLLKRPARPEADLLHLSPALAVEPDCQQATPALWRQLLAHSCNEAAQFGIERVYVSIPDGGPEQTCLSDANFRLYTRETIFRLEQIAEPEASNEPAGYRWQLPQDSWALQRLYMRSTPHLVQQAEGALGGRAGSPRLTWWEPERWRGLVWAPTGEVHGAVQVHTGRAGHWLRIVGANSLTARELRGLVGQGLCLLLATRRKWGGDPIPIYATVRDYDAGLSGALTGFGFAPFVDRARFVRHTLSACLKPLVALPVRDTTREVAAH